MSGNIVAVYCDGGLVGPINPSPIGGTWAWVQVDADGEMADSRAGVYTQILPCGNNLAEYIAMGNALRSLPAEWSGKVYSDSQNTIGRFFWGWKTNGIPAVWVERANKIVARLGKLEPILLQGHPTKADLLAGVGKARGLPVSKWNVKCDQMCREAGTLHLKSQAAA